MINISIVDDNKYFLDFIESKISSFLEENEIEFHIYRTTNPEAIIDMFSNIVFDYVFLDYDMPEHNGYEVGKILRSKDKNFKLIYVTTLEEKVFSCIENNIYRFIKKTNFENDLENCLVAIKDDLKHNLPVIFDTNVGEIGILPFNILYMEIMKKIVYIKTLNELYALKKTTLTQTYENLNSKLFVYISKGVIVNLRNVKSIDKNQLILIDNQKLFISRSNVKNVTFSYFEYKEKGE